MTPPTSFPEWWLPWRLDHTEAGAEECATAAWAAKDSELFSLARGQRIESDNSMNRGTTRLKRTPFKRKQRQGERIMKDGRVVYYGDRYAQHRRDVWEAQGHRCAECNRLIQLPEMDLDHTGKGILGGRSLGGGKRDDRKVRGLCNIPRTENGVYYPRGCHSHMKKTHECKADNEA